MNKSICVSGRCIEYMLASSNRAKRMRISIYSDGRVVVSVPRVMGAEDESFIMKKSKWIFNKLDYFKKFPVPVINKRQERRDFLRYREHALRYASQRIDHFNSQYGFAIRAIRIRNQKTRWGSCSKKGNLSFNYKIALLSQHLSDYIVVHELCHLQELNHSPAFWQLVCKAIPDYHARRKELRNAMAFLEIPSLTTDENKFSPVGSLGIISVVTAHDNASIGSLGQSENLFSLCSSLPIVKKT
ncbi:MAG: M48 family metallopeptidase [bacterium]|nr:M48 family metallopeptidase [bacterium]